MGLRSRIQRWKRHWIQDLQHCAKVGVKEMIATTGISQDC
jgi:hypothetical protein